MNFNTQRLAIHLNIGSILLTSVLSFQDKTVPDRNFTKSIAPKDGVSQ